LANKTYKEGYTPNRNREVLSTGSEHPVDPIVRPVIVRTSGLLVWQDIVSLDTNSDGDFLTSATFNQTPIVGSSLSLLVNGQTYVSANGAAQVADSAFYVTDQNGVTVRSHGGYEAGDRFRWNGSVAGYEIESEDLLKISYEV